MHVALLNQYYWPHGSATSQLLTELGEGLAARGHRVTVVTAQVDHQGRPTPSTERRHGVDVVRVRATRRGKGSLLDRLSDYGTFYASATVHLATMRPAPEVVLALTTPPLIAAAGQVAGALRRFPTVSVVQDVYPDIAAEHGVIKRGGPIWHAWRTAARASLAASRAVVVLSDTMRDRILGFGVPAARLHTIPNWALRELDERAPGDAMRLRYGFGDRFVVMYSGNMGVGHTFDGLLAAAERLAGREDIVFAFVGDGVRKREVVRAVEARALPNVRVFDYAPREDLADSLAAADLHVVTMREGMQGLLMPSKLYGILAAARPALFVGPADSAVARLITDADCGDSVRDADVDGIVAAITAAAAAPDRDRRRGLLGRDHLERHLGREHLIGRYEDLLTRIAGAPTTRTAPDASRPTATDGEARVQP
ncbi:MAG: glycosyltransferase WbuB [Deltaproteobacteria bacterium]|nr:MAG: glycosyltransferase WbuB [Deltaproteobacteria bacterium]